jgi:predicted ArsR family transcriptional regulator
MTRTETTEAFADGTPLVRLFGNGARTRMISVFVDERTRDLSISEIARQAGIARSTVYDHLDSLQELGVVVHTRTTGPSDRYRLADNEMGEFLYKLDGVTLKRSIETKH